MTEDRSDPKLLDSLLFSGLTLREDEQKSFLTRKYLESSSITPLNTIALENVTLAVVL